MMNQALEPTLRRAIPADLPGIHQVEQLSFASAGERFEFRRIDYLIRHPRFAVTVAVHTNHDDRIVGWAAGFAWLRGREPWGRLYALAVHPEARGRQLGMRLLQDMIQSLRDRGAGRVFLEVRTDNRPAIALYEKAGFRQCRTLPDYYGPDLPADRMELTADQV